MTGNRITFFVRQLDGGGAQKIMIKLANATAASGYPVEIVTLNSSGLFSDFTEKGVRVTVLSARRLLTSTWALSSYLKSAHPDVLVATEVVPNIVAVAAHFLSGNRERTRLVLREALYPSIAMKVSPHIATRIGYRLSRLFYPRADAIIAIANAMVEDLSIVARVPTSRISAININPCVDERLLTLAAEPPPHPWMEEKEIPCIVAVGRLAQQKGFSDLIKAMEILKSRRAVRLIIVGDGPLHDSLQTQIETAGLLENVMLFGKTKNPYSFMAHTPVFVMPSLHEGLGNALIEALACGAPCVATDCLVGPRETLQDGKYGKLTPVGDVEALARAIEETLDYPPDREQQRRRGLDFTSEASMREYLPVILGRAP